MRNWIFSIMLVFMGIGFTVPDSGAQQVVPDVNIGTVNPPHITYQAAAPTPIVINQAPAGEGWIARRKREKREARARKEALITAERRHQEVIEAIKDTLASAARQRGLEERIAELERKLESRE